LRGGSSDAVGWPDVWSLSSFRAGFRAGFRAAFREPDRSAAVVAIGRNALRAAWGRFVGVAIRARVEPTMTVARVTEISATSTESFDDAVKQGIQRASKTLRGITSAWVKDQNVMIENGKVSAFKINLAVTFLLDD
jgi:dodecin